MAPTMGPMRDGFESLSLSLSSSPFPAPMLKPILTQLAVGHSQMLLITSARQYKPVSQEGEQLGLHVGLGQVGDGPATGCDISVVIEEEVGRSGDRDEERLSKGELVVWAEGCR